MLQGIIIMTGSGLAIFEKVWVEGKQPMKGRLFGSLITTMMEFSRQSTGMITSYIEFDKTAVSIVDDTKTKLVCTLFHDITDGCDFGKVIGVSILRTFLEVFADFVFTGSVNTSAFTSFNSKIYEAITNSTKNILQQLQAKRGLTSCILVYDDGSSEMPVQEDDQLAIVANLQPLLTVSNDIMLLRKERSKEIIMEMSKHTIVISKLSEGSLVCVCRKNVSPKVYALHIQKAISMLENVFSLSQALSK